MSLRDIPENINKALVAVILAYAKAGFLNTEPDAEVTPFLQTLEREAPDLLQALRGFLHELRSGHFPVAPEILPTATQDQLNGIVAAIQEIKATNPGLDKPDDRESDEAESIPQHGFPGPLSARQYLFETKHAWNVDSILGMPASLLAQGQMKFAFQVLKAQWEIAKEEYGLSHENTIAAVHALGLGLEHVGEYEKAETMYREALRGAQSVLPPDSAYRLRYMARLGSLLVMRGSYEEAQGFLKAAVDASTKFFGDNDPHTADHLVELASFHMIMAEYDEADRLLKRALDSYHSSAMELSLEVAHAQHKLAQLMFIRGCYNGARVLIGLPYLSMHQHGPGQPWFADLLTTSGEIHLGCGDIERAESDLRMATKINRAVRGPSHPETGKSLCGLATVLARKKAVEEAKNLLDRSLPCVEDALGPRHIDAAAAHMAVAELALQMTKFGQAKAHLKRALSIRRDAFGDRHPLTAAINASLALLFQELRRFRRAEVLYRGALSVFEERLGERHPLVALQLRGMARLMESTGRIAAASELRLRADQIDQNPPIYDFGDSKESIFQNLKPLQGLQDRHEFTAEPVVGNQQHVAIFNEGNEAWNKWRWEHPDTVPDLSGLDLKYKHVNKMNLTGVKLCSADMSGAHLTFLDFSQADLRGAKLIGANLVGSNFNGANLEGAFLMWANLHHASLAGVQGDDQTKLIGANLSSANLSDAKLRRVDLAEANLAGATLAGADLTRANLRSAILVEADLSRATLVDCHVFGISAWKVKREGAILANLIITDRNEPVITVDDLEIAQFVHVLVHNERIRDVLNTITSKAVLILGRFSPKENKDVIDLIRYELRRRGYVPIVFDFAKPFDRDTTETAITLAGMSRFVIADITEPKSVPLELQTLVPNLMIPFVPVLRKGEKPFSMFVDLQTKYDWALAPVVYADDAELRSRFDKLLELAEKKHRELRERKTAPPQAPTMLTDL